MKKVIKKEFLHLSWCNVSRVYVDTDTKINGRRVVVLEAPVFLNESDASVFSRRLTEYDFVWIFNTLIEATRVASALDPITSYSILNFDEAPISFEVFKCHHEDGTHFFYEKRVR